MMLPDHRGPVCHSQDDYHLEGSLFAEILRVHHRDVVQAPDYHISFHCIPAHSSVEVPEDKGLVDRSLDRVADHSCNFPEEGRAWQMEAAGPN